MAHDYLLRAFLTFSLLLLVNIGWYLGGPLVQGLWSVPGAMLTTPKQSIAAVAQVDDLAAQLKTSPALTVLDKDCRRRTAGRVPLTAVPGPTAPIAKIPAALRPATNDAGVAQNIRLVCGSAALGQMRVWSIPSRLPKLTRSPGLPNPLAIPATDTIVALAKLWPPTNTNDDPAKLPPMLLQQADLRRDTDGRPIVLVITTIEPGFVTFR